MIKIVADKDLPFLDKAFDCSEEIELLKLPYDQITNSNLKNADALICLLYTSPSPRDGW